MRSLIYSEDLFGKKIIGATNGFITLKICPNDEADDVIKKYHYSHKSTKNRFASFSVNNGKGYLQLGYGIRPTLKKKIHPLIEKGNFCEFDRMWLSDDLPKFSETQTISLLLFFLKSATNIKFVITYADGSAGNTGIIYKASNAFILGKIPCDFYILESGERVHPVSMYHRHGTRAKAVLESIYPNIKHIKGQESQYRFLYILDRKLKNKWAVDNAK